MRIVFAVTFVLAAQCFSATIATAVEGPTAAGPLGGNDIRSALLPPPGTYIGTFAGWAEATAIIDGDGREIDAYRGAKLNRGLFAPFVAYVPSWQVAGGRVALSAVLPMGQSCGHLVPAARTECLSAVGDVYVEADWSIGFGHWRASADPTASPLFEGLTLLVGLGVVIPTGAYDARKTYRSGPVIGTNIIDVAPTFALTLLTPPHLADGTEISLKTHWNNYGQNPDTAYQSGDVVSTDFAVTERFGRFQLGLAGTYSRQIEDDRIYGQKVAPDGRRFEVLTLGPVANLDFPEMNMSLRGKVVSTVHVENSVESWGVTLTWIYRP